MLFENIINIFTLIATVVGLLGCLFKYIKSPKRGYLYLIVFFLSSFFSDYYWTISGLSRLERRIRVSDACRYPYA